MQASRARSASAGREVCSRAMDRLVHYDRAATAARLDRRALVAALAEAFACGGSAPVRARHEYGARGTDDGALLVMPAWDARALGVKLVTVTPANGARGLPAVNAVYLLFDARTGAPRALVDGEELTLRRTGAVSALAASRLARADASRLLVVGTGRLAPHLALCHACVRPLREIRIWGRRSAAAEQAARELAAALDGEGAGAQVSTCADLEAGVRWADLITCATLSREPLVRGAWLQPGQHVDLVGAFRPDMREADDDCLRRAAVWVDTRAGALAEAGELVQGIAAGALTADHVRGELADLVRGGGTARRDPAEITLFKSVGTALADLAAARLVVGDA